jgi:hypothetical protein
MTRSQCLRFSSELDLARLRSERRERSQAIHTPERDVLAACLAFLQRHPRVAWAKRMSTGVTRYTDHKGVERFVRFGFNGCPDIIGQLRPVPPNPVGAWLAIECKSDSGEPTDEQQAVLDTINAAGGVAFVARSIDDVMLALQDA